MDPLDARNEPRTEAGKRLFGATVIESWEDAQMLAAILALLGESE